MPRTAPPAADPSAARGGRRIQVRRSGVHGRGVFAAQDIAEGEVLAEYTGEVISWQEAQDRHPHDPKQPNHTFYFHVDEDRVIDAKHGGNSSRWINHSCAPNCYADERGGRIFITALRNIRAGEELNYDYGLIIDERYTPKLKAEYPCWCGSPQCRGTLLAPKRGWAPPGPPAPPREAQTKVKAQAKAPPQPGRKAAARPETRAAAPAPQRKARSPRR
ncbi:SET domain-containing protein-lysine N-methyltransferase [Acidovorax sp. GBBC 3334]|uniref:SET domain-containing protein n=1 Tax=Acidovorax sp. GBBC 3334 TaxID=2940496 RepID=UPI0023030C34|nr:SET domain-containing protein-lysine N-methyltransferase [Acidovorax sp. GBBC 3334]MDA8455150.1 SET domain-containing protein-lysine N-methyltransferase [Acidovorax sp. GBBC 3334]